MGEELRKLRPLDASDYERLITWISNQRLSRPRPSLSSSFCDGCLVGELLEATGSDAVLEGLRRPEEDAQAGTVDLLALEDRLWNWSLLRPALLAAGVTLSEQDAEAVARRNVVATEHLLLRCFRAWEGKSSMLAASQQRGSSTGKPPAGPSKASKTSRTSRTSSSAATTVIRPSMASLAAQLTPAKAGKTSPVPGTAQSPGSSAGGSPARARTDSIAADRGRRALRQALAKADAMSWWKKLPVMRQAHEAIYRLWDEVLPRVLDEPHPIDLVLVLPEAEEKTSQVLGFFDVQLTALGYAVSSAKSSDGSDVYVKISASFDLLLRLAETARLVRPLKAGGGARRDAYSRRFHDQYENADDPGRFFTSLERQQLVLDHVRSIKALKTGPGVAGISFYQGEEILPRLVCDKVVRVIFTLHDDEEKDRLYQSWVMTASLSAPLDEIRGYLGEEIGFYFAWLDSYTRWLIVPAVVGLGVTLFEWYDIPLPFPLVPFFCVFISLWDTLRHKAWQRRETVLAHEWDVLGIEEREHTRPEFVGDIVPCEVTGKHRRVFSSRRRFYRYLVSTPVLLAMTYPLVAVTKFTLDMQTDPTSPYSDRSSLLFYVPVVIQSVAVPALNAVYTPLAKRLNDFENHQHERQHRNMLIIKRVVFAFASRFVTLFFFAFYLRDMDLLTKQLAGLLISGQIIGNLLEFGTPIVKYRLSLFFSRKRRAASADKAKKEKMSLATASKVASAASKLTAGAHASSRSPPRARAMTAEEEEEANLIPRVDAEVAMPTYDETFDDYLEMLLQYGYVTLFASAFPLATVMALVNNVMELHTDAFKILSSRRPLARRVPNIGTWSVCFTAVSYLAIMTNIGVMFVTSRVLDDYFDSPTDRQWTVFMFEHGVIALKILVAVFISNVPHAVDVEMRRRKYRERVRLALLESREATRAARKQERRLAASASAHRHSPTGLRQRRRAASPFSPGSVVSHAGTASSTGGHETEDEDDFSAVFSAVHI